MRVTGPEKPAEATRGQRGLHAEDDFRRPTWLRALTIQERLTSLRARRGNPHTGLAYDSDLARHRLEQWRAEPPLGQSTQLIDPLELHDCSEDELLRILGEPIEAMAERSAGPEWLSDLQAAFSAPSASVSWSPPSGDWPGVQFLAALRIPIDAARRRFLDACRLLKNEYRHAPYEPESLVDSFFEIVLPRLTHLVVRTAVVELHAARLHGVLHAETPVDRFEEFVASLSGRATARTLLRDYPVLARLTATTLSDWVDFGAEVLERLALDWELLCRNYGLRDDDVLVGVRATGDRHRRGRAVSVLTFRSGESVVYKPRSLAAEAHFQDLLRWLNDQTDLPRLRPIRVVARGCYGWSEFVEATPCSTRDELRNFYERQGILLALLYVLAASDFHFENVIASGEHPILIDHECLLQPSLPSEARGLRGAERLAVEATLESVVTVGLLPRPEHVGGVDDATDLTGLGAVPGQRAPVRLPHWDRTGTDDMRHVLRHAEILQMLHSPAAPDAELPVRNFVDDVVRGFESTYRVLVRHRDALLEPHGPLAAFADDEIRSILRPTLSYGMLLDSCAHPHFLGDALQREQRFDRLLGAADELENQTITNAEREDLWRDDIPLFVTRPTTRDLWTSTGARVPAFFAEGGIDRATRRIARLSESDLQRQSWMVRMSIASSGLTSDTIEYPRRASHSPGRLATRDQLIASAIAVGTRLGELAFNDNGDATWIGVRSRRGNNWRIDPVNSDLYGGLAGIIHFLAYLGFVVGDDRHIALARGGLGPLRRQIERDREVLTCGAFDGIAGIVYVLVHMSEILDDPELLDDAERLLAPLASVVETTQESDIISGTAGCAAALLAVAHLLPHTQVSGLLRTCGDRLVESALEMDHGIGWSMPGRTWQPLGGFSHGVAGIAWALLQLHRVFDDRKLLDAAVGAIEYQRSLFSPETGNWRDLRVFGNDSATDEAPGFMAHWCHGSAGIALAWLGCTAHLDDRELRREIEIALSTTRASGFGFSHCLCHGDLGNAEALVEGAKAGLGARPSDVATVAGSVVDGIAQHGWVTGFPLGLEAPGMMMGLAGIGYGLLRLAEPETVPSILLLESPRPKP